jgi:hypothetical protein
MSLVQDRDQWLAVVEYGNERKTEGSFYLVKIALKYDILLKCSAPLLHDFGLLYCDACTHC